MCTFGIEWAHKVVNLAASNPANTVESGNSKLGFVTNYFFLLMRDFYYSETFLDFLLFNNLDFMLTHRAHYS
jgi:hypothetical protein